ncbi:MAG: sugar ABC transporter ATP-binding protein [Clostridia bacterium]|nr:sugar ABC transporter ATP-binding protein [Clostridia bacterium]
MGANGEVKLEISHVSKSFPGVKALNDICLKIRRGKTHVLCGENGAGKSTLMKIINGIYKPDSGSILLDGKPVTIANPIHARGLGISMIFQELSYVPELTVAENIFLGRWPTDRFKRVDFSTMRKKTKELLEKEGLNYSPDEKLKNLSVSDIQMLEIIKAVSNDSDIIIMDEPTSAITEKEIEKLFSMINAMKSRGASIIYISHKLDEIFTIADEITVLRDGAVVDTRPAADLDMDEVIAMMVGRRMDNKYPYENVKKGDTLLRVSGLSGEAFHDINFEVKAGEIVGFAGLMGAGRTEVVRALFGLDPVTGGTVEMFSKPVSRLSVRDSIENGMVMLSEDRRRYGLVPIRSVMENVSLASLEKFIYSGRLHRDEEKKTVSEMCSSMNVKTPSLETTVEALSGGNQQKIVLAKWMVRNPEILLMDEPTRGIDVGAKYEIYKLMIKLAGEGKAIVMVSSELPELIGMCDRIYVLCQGSIAGELKRDEFSAEHIMALATGAGKSAR